MLNKHEIDALKAGQAVFIPSPVRSAEEGSLVMVVPVHSRRNGQIVRMLLYSKNPDREKGDARK